jgi:hypothetical protein
MIDDILPLSSKDDSIKREERKNTKDRNVKKYT